MFDRNTRFFTVEISSSAAQTTFHLTLTASTLSRHMVIIEQRTARSVCERDVVILNQCLENGSYVRADPNCRRRSARLTIACSGPPAVAPSRTKRQRTPPHHSRRPIGLPPHGRLALTRSDQGPMARGRAATSAWVSHAPPPDFLKTVSRTPRCQLVTTAFTSWSRSAALLPQPTGPDPEGGAMKNVDPACPDPFADQSIPAYYGGADSRHQT